MKFAIIAHDQKKEALVSFIKQHIDEFSRHELFATGTTGLRVSEQTGLHVHRFNSGPLGGDQEIGALVANKEIDAIFFFRDPLTAQPHEPDVSALLRLSDVYDVPLATNEGSAGAIISYYESLGD
ncbi:methylglyoxal synthase [Macrococcus equipercicus]|uniref:Methylglyoxal synthase n=1 Tax=Macrococcus equipercicus TaxID=69967 RepID=A0A9Q9BNK5_9STAP|nr:methylglyoxal synthase [Macrococcus equipercicus]KAA1040199.1 methylglyoxal synthase [Macrococcus equipercicus]UTH12856.1 methylglyoxal synthase [Macrococcus equipercicus]